MVLATVEELAVTCHLADSGPKATGDNHIARLYVDWGKK
jgi:hypothetical protein